MRDSHTSPNHALQRTRPSRPGCNPRVPWARSLSLGSLIWLRARNIQQHHIRQLCILAAWFFCSGCFPYRYTDNAGLAGRVVDANSGLPIVGAEVSVSSRKTDGTIFSTRSSVSREFGDFRIGSDGSWGVVFIYPGDPRTWTTSATVGSPGYRPYMTNCLTSSFGPGRLDLRTVYLVPLRP